MLKTSIFWRNWSIEKKIDSNSVFSSIFLKDLFSSEIHLIICDKWTLAFHLWPQQGFGPFTRIQTSIHKTFLGPPPYPTPSMESLQMSLACLCHGLLSCRKISQKNPRQSKLIVVKIDFFMEWNATKRIPKIRSTFLACCTSNWHTRTFSVFHQSYLLILLKLGRFSKMQGNFFLIFEMHKKLLRLTILLDFFGMHMQSACKFLAPRLFDMRD